MDRQEVENLGQAMLGIGQDLFGRQKLDVYVWEDPDPRAAWVLDPLKLQRILTGGPDGMMSVRGMVADSSLSRHLGRKVDRMRYSEPFAPSDFLAHISDILRDLVEEDEDLQVTFIPRPGYPWPVDRYYSVRKGKWFEPDTPPWLLPERVVDEGRNIDSYGVDLCSVLPSGAHTALGGVVGEFSGRSGGYMIVSHAMGGLEGVTRQGGWTETAESINACGGLLMPSLGVGASTSANFGLTALIADVGLVVGGLRPYRGRGAWPVRVYDTDAWTGTTGDFLREGAVAAFEQLHGHSEYMYYVETHIWLLGAPEGAGGPAEATPIETTSKLAAAVKRRAKLWSRDLTPEQIEQRAFDIWKTPERYPYLEAKVNGVVPMDAFPMAIAPPHLMSQFGDMLERTEFDGELVEVPLPDEVAEVMESRWWPSGMDIDKRNAIQQWGWQQYGYNAADVIREHGSHVEIEVKR